MLAARDRAVAYAVETLAETDLVAALLSGPAPRRHALAATVLQQCGGAAGLRSLDAVAAGITVGERRRLSAAVELGRRALFEPVARRPIHSPEDAYACVAPTLVGSETERFVVVVLDVRNRPRAVAQVASGAVDACPVDPREVFVPAIRERGSSVIVAHNHPSGDPDPSPEDIALTRRLREAGEVLGLPLLDHVIVGSGSRYHSFAQSGMLAGC